MFAEIFLSSDERGEKASSLADTPEGEGDAVDSAVSSEPIFGFHTGDECFEFRSEPVTASF